MKTNDPQDGFVSIKPRGRQNLISQKNEFKSKFKKPKAFIKPKPSGKKTFHHYNHLEGDRDTKFTSNINSSVNGEIKQTIIPTQNPKHMGQRNNTPTVPLVGLILLKMEP